MTVYPVDWPYWDSDSGPLVIQPVSSHNADYTTMALFTGQYGIILQKIELSITTAYMNVVGVFTALAISHA
jgi:hypothetical protein